MENEYWVEVTKKGETLYIREREAYVIEVLEA